MTKSGRKIDLLYLDACLMGMWEVAHEVHNEVNYLLASESWSWTTFAYDKHLAGMSNSQSITQTGQAWIENEAAILRRDRYPFTYSLLDLTHIPTVTTSVDILAQNLKTVAATPDGHKKIGNAIAVSACFDSNADHIINRDNPSAGKLDNYCDLSSFADQLQQQFPNTPDLVSAAQTVQGSVAKLVIYKDSGCGVPGHYSAIPWCWQKLGGLSIYTPLGEDDWKRGLYTQLQVASDTQWNEFIDQYWNNVAPAAPECPTEGCPLPIGLLEINYTTYLPVVQR